MLKSWSDRSIRSRIRVAIAAGTLLAATAGCGIADVAQPATSPTVIHASATPTPTEPGSAWVISPIGVNLRAAADPGAQRLTTLAWSVRLDVLDASNAGWLKVKAHDGSTVGWVSSDPGLVTTTPVKPADDSPGGYSLLVPQDWVVTPGTPARYTGASQQLAVYLATRVEQLPPAPLRTGTADRQGGPVEVYGKTAFYTVYRSQGGGGEIALAVQVTDSRAILLDFTDSAQAVDLPRFNQLIASVVVR